MNLRDLFRQESSRHEVMVTGQVVPDPARCVQCGICSFYCPVGIDIRHHAWIGQPVKDSYCLTCAECIRRCPRSVLRFERTGLIMEPDS